MRRLALSLLTFAIPGLLFSGCGTTSTERQEHVSDCRLETPLEIGTNTPGTSGRNGLQLTDVVFYVNPISESVTSQRSDKPFEVRLFNVQIGAEAKAELLGFELQPARHVGFFPSYNDPVVKPDQQDAEEGFRQYFPGRRILSGRVRQTAETYQYTTLMAEGVLHKDPTDKTMLTSLRATVDNKKLTSLEFNIPVTKTGGWRDGPSSLPLLDAWLRLNESICVKSARVKN